ncbi:MAG: serine protease [Enterobacteriaceae bacterium]
MTHSASALAISGGTDAIPGEFPYFAAIAMYEKPPAEDSIFCGAALIAPKWIITVRHCMTGPDVKNIRIILGKYTRSTATPGQITLSVEKVSNYPDSRADIVLVKLKTAAPVTFRPVNFNFIDRLHAGLMGTVIGFGREQPDVVTKHLQKMEEPVIPTELCKTPTFQVDDETQFCAGYFYTSVSAHPGDSGGPFIVYWADTPILIGVYQGHYRSYPGYDNDSWPTKYERISFFYPWIKSTMCLNGGPCSESWLASLPIQVP